MNDTELQEIYEGLLSSFVPESSAGQALVFVNQILTVKCREDAAQALFWLIHLIQTSGRENVFPIIIAKLWARACADGGEDFILAAAEKLGVLRED